VSKVAGRPIERVSQYVLEAKSQWSACAHKREKREERNKRSGERQEGVLAMVDSWHHLVHTPNARVIKVI
jgi:hypothetical protein